MPFSLWNSTEMPSGMWFATSVGMPMPRLTYQPSRSSCAMRRAMPFLSNMGQSKCKARSTSWLYTARAASRRFGSAVSFTSR